MRNTLGGTVAGRRPQVVELRLMRPDDMFEMPQTDLFSEYRNFLTGVDFCLSELRGRLSRRPVRLEIRLPPEEIDGELAERMRRTLRRYCAHRLRYNRRETRALRVGGLGAFRIGLPVSALGLLLTAVATTIRPENGAGNLITDHIGWVLAWLGLWFPLDEILFYPLVYGQESRALRMLAEAAVVVIPLDQPTSPARDRWLSPGQRGTSSPTAECRRRENSCRDFPGVPSRASPAKVRLVGRLAQSGPLALATGASIGSGRNAPMALPEYNELSTTELEGMLRQSTAPEERNAISQELSRRYANGAVGQAPAAQPSPAHAAQPGVAMTQPTLAAAAPPLAADDTSPDLAPAARTGTERTGKMIASVVAAIIGILFIIAGFIYLAVPADSVPSIMGRIAGSTGHHPLRAAGCLIVGVVLLIAAWFVLRYQPKARNSGGAETNSPAG